MRTTTTTTMDMTMMGNSNGEASLACSYSSETLIWIVLTLIAIISTS